MLKIASAKAIISSRGRARRRRMAANFAEAAGAIAPK
jgi:hypothetical protein